MFVLLDCLPAGLRSAGQVFGGAGAAIWRVHAPHAARPPGSLRRGSLRASLPMRIDYCRWLD